MASLIYRKIVQYKDRHIQRAFGRDLISTWCVSYIAESGLKSINILDLGCGRGNDLIAIRNKIQIHSPDAKVNLYGVEGFVESAAIAKSKGINVVSADLEKDILPFEDEYFDIVISNQVIEHTKEIFWIFSEVSRVIKKGGFSITGVPNLASFHNRLLLFFGQQPSCIEMLGPHVRGITYPAFKKFIETDGHFEVTKKAGSFFYPFPPGISALLEKIFPMACASIFIGCHRSSKSGLYIDVLRERFFETPFFRGHE